MEISISNITKSYSVFDVLRGVTFVVNKGDKIGIVGANGCGKTTLFRIIKGTEYPNSGEIHIKKNTKIGYLDQIPDYQETVEEVLYQAFEDILLKKASLTKLEKDLSDNPQDSDLLRIYGQAQEEFENIGGYDVDNEYNKIVRGLKIHSHLLSKPFKMLSGGEKSRVVLGKILLEKPDILLLDEPSNHLDLQSISWLESYLQAYDGSVMIISHDRYLLDKVTTRIINIERGKAITYSGNYSFYVQEKARKMEEQWKLYKAQQKKIKKMEEQIERYRIWGRMRDSDKMFRMAKQIEHRLDRLDKIDKPFKNKEINMSFDRIGRTGNEVITFKNYEKSYNTKLLDKTNFIIRYQDRAFLLGRNGTGKTTIFRSILKEIEYDGEIKITPRAKIGFLSQEIIYPHPKKTILQEFTDSVPMSTGEARSKLAKFLFFGDEVYKSIGSISGGEKSRLELCKMVNNDTNVLLLDEPTNHLDIESKEMLEQTLLDYPGTMFIISHDRYFINRLSDYILCIEDCNINKYEGDYDIYFEKKEKKIVKKSSSKPKRETKKNDYSKEILELETKIIKVEEEISLELKNDSPDFTLIDELVKRKTELESEYDSYIKKLI